MAGRSHGKSRRKTPWDAEVDLTPTQKFLRTHYQERYMARHPKLNETGEAELINSFEPSRCPYCSSEEFTKRGFTSNGIQRYSCLCGRRFLIISLGFNSQAYLADDLKGLKDSENPMNPINRIHDSLKKFLNAHSGFNRDSLQSYLNLFAFVRNPPHEPLEKVAMILNLVFENPKSLRYREQFSLNKDF